jgi:predicted ATP-grasp superfamily ATP-dependent carboligase
MVMKKKFYQSLMDRNIPHPITIFSDNEDARNIKKEFSLPVFVKPSISQTFNRKFGTKGFVAYSQKELDHYLKLGKKYKIELMAQEIIPGTADNHYFIDGYFDKNSKPMALFARKRIRMWPLNFGNSTVCISIPISEVAEMRDTIVKYLSDIGYRGIFSAEFKKDPRDNVVKLLEVNARSWWYNFFPSVCGLDITLLAYQDAIGINIGVKDKYETGIFLMHFFLDLMASFSMITRKQLHFKDWVFPFVNQIHDVVYASDDPAPFIIKVGYVLNKLIRSHRIIS